MNKNSNPSEAVKRAGGFFSREAVSGVPWMVLGKLVLFFVYFGITILTVNNLGKEGYGVFSLMTNISSYLVVVCGLGLGAALTRYVPELAARENRRGLVHLLWKSATLQVLAIVAATLLLLLFSEPLQRLFKAESVGNFAFYLKLACGLTGLLLLKTFVATVYTSLFKTRIVVTLSIIQGIIWVTVLFVWLQLRPEVGTALYVQMLSIALVYFLGMVLLIRHIGRLDWHTDEFGIGRRRALQFSGTAIVSAVLRMIMFKYSEIFFLAAVGGTTLAGIYDLGYSLPYTMVTFIPLALLPLFSAAFAEAYVKDPDCLGRLIRAFYKLLMVVSLPVAVLGVFFSPIAYHIIYHGEMDAAGTLAGVFCGVLLLPLVSIPLSMALKAKEKVHSMLPMMVFQICINLFLDWLLIVNQGMGVRGGIYAVVGTFVLTIVPRMMVVKRVIGGIYFPAAFLFRITLALVFDAALLFWLSQRLKLFERFEADWINIGLLFVIAMFYAGFFLLLVRVFHLVRKSDVAEFKALNIQKLNRLLRLIVGS